MTRTREDPRPPPLPVFLGALGALLICAQPAFGASGEATACRDLSIAKWNVPPAWKKVKKGVRLCLAPLARANKEPCRVERVVEVRRAPGGGAVISCRSACTAVQDLVTGKGTHPFAVTWRVWPGSPPWNRFGVIECRPGDLLAGAGGAPKKPPPRAEPETPRAPAEQHTTPEPPRTAAPLPAPSEPDPIFGQVPERRASCLPAADTAARDALRQCERSLVECVERMEALEPAAEQRERPADGCGDTAATPRRPEVCVFSDSPRGFGATSRTLVVGNVPFRFVRVGGGRVRLGFSLKEARRVTHGLRGKDPARRAIFDAWPAYEETLSPFWLLDREITGRQMTAVLKDSPYPPDDSPARPVSWEQATLFAAELQTLCPNTVVALPTEAEIEHAAKTLGAARSKSRRALPSCTTRTGVPLRGEVLGLLGGLWEWTSTPWRPYPRNRKTRRVANAHVLRGGCSGCPPTMCTPEARVAGVAGSDVPTGFRVVLRERP